LGEAIWGGALDAEGTGGCAAGVDKEGAGGREVTSLCGRGSVVMGCVEVFAGAGAAGVGVVVVEGGLGSEVIGCGVLVCANSWKGHAIRNQTTGMTI